jgi:hypothetical protein
VDCGDMFAHQIWLIWRLLLPKFPHWPDVVHPSPCHSGKLKPWSTVTISIIQTIDRSIQKLLETNFGGISITLRTAISICNPGLRSGCARTADVKSVYYWWQQRNTWWMHVFQVCSIPWIVWLWVQHAFLWCSQLLFENFMTATNCQFDKSI